MEHPIPGRRLPGCVPLYIKSIPSQTEAALLGFLLLHKDETPFDTFCFCCLLWGNVFHTNLAHGWNDVGSQKYGVKQHHWLFPKFFFFLLSGDLGRCVEWKISTTVAGPVARKVIFCEEELLVFSKKYASLDFV